MSEVELNMKDVSDKILETLKAFVGKRLEWVCFDEHTESFYLVFDGMKTLAVSEASPVIDGEAFAKDYLKSNLEKAKQTLELQTIFQKNTSQMPLPLAEVKGAVTYPIAPAVEEVPVIGVLGHDHQPMIPQSKQGEPNGPLADQSGTAPTPQA